MSAQGEDRARLLFGPPRTEALHPLSDEALGRRFDGVRATGQPQSPKAQVVQAVGIGAERAARLCADCQGKGRPGPAFEQVGGLAEGRRPEQTT